MNFMIVCVDGDKKSFSNEVLPFDSHHLLHRTTSLQNNFTSKCRFLHKNWLSDFFLNK